MKKKLANITPQKEPLVSVGKIEEGKPSIGITYLSHSEYGLSDFFKACRSDKKHLSAFESFLEKAKSYETLSELIKNHASRHKTKNTDDKSIKKLKEIQSMYNVETSDMFHLHCDRDGKGKFVLHGFRINNCFEIVWIDPNHEFYK